MTYGMLRNSLSKYKQPDNKIKRMSDAGEIIRLTKNIYETEKNIPGYLYANILYGPSYISFEYALSYHGLIPEAVYVYTSATFNKRKKKSYHNTFGTYTYRDVPSKAYCYDILVIENDIYPYSIASAEKALCDKLYTLKPIRSIKDLKIILFDDLRIDQNAFNQLDFNKMNTLCDLYNSTTLKTFKKMIGEKNEYVNSTNAEKI